MTRPQTTASETKGFGIPIPQTPRLSTRLTGFSLAATTALLLGLSFFSGGQKAAADKPAPQFVRDIAPILDKKGCSTAGCHGKFGGRGGFQVSLLTLSPVDDYAPIALGGRGRRINLVEPEKSLILLKATGKLAHGGGERFKVGSPEYNVIRDWISAGAPFDPHADVNIKSLSILPPSFVLPKAGAQQQLKVVAEFTDGSRRDVTSYANYESADTAVATADGAGAIKGLRWGGGAVVVRYLGEVKAAFLTLPREDKTPYPAVQGFNFIDDFVLSNLKKMNVIPSRLTTDREFIRRVYLDLCGRLPEPAEVTAFATDTTPDKRAKLIDKLLDSPEFVDMRTLRIGDLLRIHPQRFGGNIQGERSAALLTEWVHDAVESNMPYDKFVHELIAARGSSSRVGPVNFYRVERTPEDRMETVSQAFLGQRMACARCHKHPFDRWTTDDFWNFAAFMGRVGSRGRALDGEEEIYHEPYGRVINQSVTGKRGKEAMPTLLAATEPMKLTATNGQRTDVVEKLADWAVSKQNPYFAKATVNRLWSHYLGRGVVHPVDDMRATTPPSVPGLLEAMAKDFVKNGYDVKQAIRVILNSRTYQTSSEPNATNALDTKFYAKFYPRPMLSPVLLDALNQATGAQERFGDFPPDYRTVKLTLPVGSYFLDTFGRSHREFLAELEPKVEPTLVQTLHILNSPYIEDKVRTSNGTLTKLLADKTVTDGKLILALYQKTLSRPPTQKEMMAALTYFKKSAKREEAAQDLLWALVSAREFYFVS
jgi:hypothetical protein